MHGEEFAEFSAILGWKALKDSVDQFGDDKDGFTRLVISLDGKDPDDAFSSIPYVLLSPYSILTVRKKDSIYCTKFRLKLVAPKSLNHLYPRISVITASSLLPLSNSKTFCIVGLLANTAKGWERNWMRSTGTDGCMVEECLPLLRNSIRLLQHQPMISQSNGPTPLQRTQIRKTWISTSRISKDGMPNRFVFPFHWSLAKNRCVSRIFGWPFTSLVSAVYLTYGFRVRFLLLQKCGNYLEILYHCDAGSLG